MKFPLKIYMETHNNSEQKIICKIEEDKYAGELFLFQYKGDKNEGYIWVNTFVRKQLSKSENDFLDRINGLVIPENDQRYNQILKLTKQISYLDHNPLSMIQKTSTLNIKHEIYKILNSFT